MFIGLASHTCPYCFETFRLAQTPFRCTSPMARCAPEVDEVRARVWRETLPLGRVLPAAGGRRREVRCEQCSQVSRKRLCPHCHMELPHTVGQHRHLIFAVIGAKDAGKSHYLAVLIDQIRKHIGPSLGMLLEPLNDHTVRRYREDFYNPLFERGSVIRGTISALADQRVQMPLIYSLTLSGKSLWGQQRIRGVVTLVFFDTAGEDLDSEDVMATVNKYIYRADGLLLLLDPLQLPRVRSQLEGTTTLPARNTESATLLERTTRLIRQGRQLSLTERLKTPIAVAFSKFDAVEELLDSQLQIRAPSRHEVGFDLADHAAVQAEMQAVLADWDGEVLRNHLRTSYRRFGFFGFSALGCNPGTDKKVPHVLPRRVEDPFLWLLHCHGLVPTSSDAARRMR
jgi:hypothetical protein